MGISPNTWGLGINAYNPYSGGYPPPQPPPPPDNYRRYGLADRGYDVGSYPLSPAAIAYLFPEYFSRRTSIGGFKSPCNNIKVKHDDLFYSMFILTLLAMEERRLIRFYTYKEGRIFKRTRIGIYKTNSFGQIDFGYMGRRLARMYPSTNISAASVILENIEVNYPIKYFIGQVYRYDICGRNLFWRDDPKKPICERIMIYRGEAERLYNLLNQFRSYRNYEYKLLEGEAYSAISSMKPEREDYDYY